MISQQKKALIAQALEELKGQLGPARLIAVTKYTGLEEISYAYEMGQRLFGENRVQDLLKKNEQLSDLKELRWHFIGHLQRNKVKDLLKVDRLAAIHSVDSLSLLEKIIELRKMEMRGHSEIQVPLDLFFEVNTSGEKEKWGFTDSQQLKEAFLKTLQEGASAWISPVGLMTMGTFRTNHAEAEAHRCFKYLQSMKLDLEQSLKLTDLKLSMGMSSDYKIALQYGADYIRIGSNIFG